MLGVRQHMILAFEKKRWKYAGAKEAAIRHTFGVPPPRYWQEVNALIDDPEALAAEPQLVRRLQRLRAARAAVRRAG